MLVLISLKGDFLLNGNSWKIPRSLSPYKIVYFPISDFLRIFSTFYLPNLILIKNPQLSVKQLRIISLWSDASGFLRSFLKSYVLYFLYCTKRKYFKDYEKCFYLESPFFCGFFPFPHFSGDSRGQRKLEIILFNPKRDW